jgi:acetyl-CoA carboxylase biotin carboxyl carrier protein
MSAAKANSLVPIEATVASVFYRRPSPGEPPFVEVGDQVNEDTVVCLLEIMKCFRSVGAGVKGKVEQILVESGALVKKGETLMLIRPEK